MMLVLPPIPHEEDVGRDDVRIGVFRAGPAQLDLAIPARQRLDLAGVVPGGGVVEGRRHVRFPSLMAVHAPPSIIVGLMRWGGSLARPSWSSTASYRIVKALQGRASSSPNAKTDGGRFVRTRSHRFDQTSWDWSDFFGTNPPSGLIKAGSPSNPTRQRRREPKSVSPQTRALRNR
jgi:hypothetical protein